MENLGGKSCISRNQIEFRESTILTPFTKECSQALVTTMTLNLWSSAEGYELNYML